MQTENFSYQTRPIRFLEPWKIGNWQMKVYGIAYQKEKPQPKLVDAAKKIARDKLSEVSPSLKHYHVGFVGIHEGKTANFVFVDWWAEENELHNHVYVSTHDSLTKFSYRTPTGLMACVWDLRLMCHEREAWINMVLKNKNGADFEAYLLKKT